MNRRLRLSLLSFLCVGFFLCLALFGLAAAQDARNLGALELNQTREANIPPATAQVWRLAAGANKFVAIEILQKDVNLAGRIVNPAGAVVYEFKSLKANGEWQRAVWFTRESGVWQVEITSLDSILAGAYRIRWLLQQNLTDVKSELNVADSLFKQATVHYYRGQYAKAERLFGSVLKTRQKAFGPNHENSAIVLNNLALLYHTQGKYGAAEPLYERALAINEQALGGEHPDVAMSLNNLAELYRAQGKYGAAEPLYQRALAIFEQALGGEHPDVAMSLNNLAGLYHAQGKYGAAKPLYQRALAISEQALGGEHPEVATSLNNLALLYMTQGKYSEAQPLYSRGHRNLLNQIQRYFVSMSEDDKRKFYQTIDKNFEFYNSFVVRRRVNNPVITADMYNNQLATKALLLNSTSKVKRLILNSGDHVLIELFKKWLTEKEYLAKVYTLSKAEIAQQGIDKDSLEAVANDLEKQLSRQSQAFAAATDTTLFTWQDVKNYLQPRQAAVEMVRFKWFNKTWTDTVYYAALIVTPETKDYPELVLLENGNDLEAQHFQEYLKSRKGKNNIAYQLYWQPIAQKLTGITKVYFSPDGIYNKINLNILPNPETGKYVLDEIELHLVTNTKDILRFDEKRESNKVAHLFGRASL